MKGNIQYSHSGTCKILIYPAPKEMGEKAKTLAKNTR
jgi:hypothetical protein